MATVEYRLTDETIDKIVAAVETTDRADPLAVEMVQLIPAGHDSEYYRGLATVAYLIIDLRTKRTPQHVINQIVGHVLARASELVDTSRPRGG